jgi:hypothetical protein
MSFKSIIKVLHNEFIMSPKVRDLLFRPSDSKEPGKGPKPVSESSPTNSESGTRTTPSIAASVTHQSANPSASPRVPEPQKQLKTPPASATHAPHKTAGQAPTTRGRRRPKNTVVVSLQMPTALVRVLDEIVDAGGYRSRSDLILQAVRSHSDVSRRLTLLKSNQPRNK